jgi:aspartate carbamoyltransferase catalytic subunit
MTNIKNLIRIEDLDKKQILSIIKKAADFKKSRKSNCLVNKIGAVLFFEPSTRTRLSFEAAILKLGGKFIGFTDASTTSQTKGESLEDTISIVEKYADFIIIRHPEAGAADRAAAVTKKFVINAGDGANEHPTQTLIDLFAIQETQGKLDNLNIAIAGDLKYGRVPHSLVRALKLFNNKIFLVSPDSLKMPKEYLGNIDYQEKKDLLKILPQMDILYMTRVQKERFKNLSEYNKVKNSFILKKEMLKKVKTNLKILHALPRINEIETDVDKTKHAYYFNQAANGVYVRMAILEKYA